MAAYYTIATTFVKRTLARAEKINAEYTAIVAAFNKIPEEFSLKEDRHSYAADTGVADAYLVALPTTLTAYTAGLRIAVKILNTNTGASTINVDSVGAKSIKRYDGTALQANDLPAGSIPILTYDGTDFLFSFKVGTAAANTAIIGPASATDNALVRFNGTTGKSAQDSSLKVDDDGIATNALQPAFAAVNSSDDSNVTGDGTTVTVDFDTELFDNNNDFTGDTFTAPVTGKYLLSTNVRVDGLTTAVTSWQIRIAVVGTSSYTFKATTVQTGTGLATSAMLQLSVLAPMTATDTAIVQVVVSGIGSKVCDIHGGNPSETIFSGHLVA